MNVHPGFASLRRDQLNARSADVQLGAAPPVVTSGQAAHVGRLKS